MSNELILLASVVVFFGGALIWMRLFGEKGLIAYSVVATIASNIEVLILINAFGIEQTLGNVLFASTALVNSILCEIKGKEAAKKAVHMSVAASVSFIIISHSWLLFTPSPNDFAYSGISVIASNTPRIMISSLIVNVISQRFDVWAFHKIWDITAKLTGSRKALLWVRNNFSTFVSQLINIVLFNLAAFGGVYNNSTLFDICVSGYIIYVIASMLDTPFLYFARHICQKHPI